MRNDEPSTALDADTLPASSAIHDRASGREWITPAMIRRMRPPGRLKVVAESSLGEAADQIASGKGRP
jgi:hypothetical protein